MKCPYRISIHRKEYKEGDSTITREQTIYENCYGDLCPFYVSTDGEDCCAKVLTEVKEGF